MVKRIGNQFRQNKKNLAGMFFRRRDPLDHAGQGWHHIQTFQILRLEMKRHAQAIAAMFRIRHMSNRLHHRAWRRNCRHEHGNIICQRTHPMRVERLFRFAAGLFRALVGRGGVLESVSPLPASKEMSER